ncbi:MAG: galactokinase [Desulfobacteraceae bacterium]|nr:galactokinase [Desulfobacteraceae bacterium]
MSEKASHAIKERVQGVLRQYRILASAPCRIDMGGTLDISSLFYPLAHLGPCTFNIALDMRTRMSLHPWKPGLVRAESTGFSPAEYRLEEAPFDHSLGLMFAVAAYFGIDGILIRADSASPPRSALGGSSCAAVALVAAYFALLEAAGYDCPGLEVIPVLAHGIEESIAGVPCGMQDQLAAAYGGVSAWYWEQKAGRPGWRRRELLDPKETGRLNERILVAYCGVPHESVDINAEWICRFLAGKDRARWSEIVDITKKFTDAFSSRDYDAAVCYMNRETEIRRDITPRVVDETGAELIEAAIAENCGARFSGAGGGGCIWAFGSAKDISGLRGKWSAVSARRPGVRILEAKVDARGLNANCKMY